MSLGCPGGGEEAGRKRRMSWLSLVMKESGLVGAAVDVLEAMVAMGCAWRDVDGYWWWWWVSEGGQKEAEGGLVYVKYVLEV